MSLGCCDPQEICLYSALFNGSLPPVHSSVRPFDRPPRSWLFVHIRNLLPISKSKSVVVALPQSHTAEESKSKTKQNKSKTNEKKNLFSWTKQKRRVNKKIKNKKYIDETTGLRERTSPSARQANNFSASFPHSDVDFSLAARWHALN